MKKTIKLKKNYQFNNTFKKGKYYNGKLIECFYKKNNKNINFFGIAVSSKNYNAVKRNRIKRVVREAYRSLEKNISLGNTIVFLWKKNKNIKECTYQEVQNDMEKILKKIGIYTNEQTVD